VHRFNVCNQCLSSINVKIMFPNNQSEILIRFNECRIEQKFRVIQFHSVLFFFYVAVIDSAALPPQRANVHSLNKSPPQYCEQHAQDALSLSQ